jgi:hypothetical protein
LVFIFKIFIVSRAPGAHTFILAAWEIDRIMVEASLEK